jgi:hypothetical protein
MYDLVSVSSCGKKLDTECHKAEPTFDIEHIYPSQIKHFD